MNDNTTTSVPTQGTSMTTDHEAHVEMMGLIGMGNNPMVGATVAVAVAIAQAK